MSDPAAPSDSALVRAAQAGDRAAFGVLADRHRHRLVRVIAGLVWDADEAESIAQEALARSLAGLAGFRPPTPFGAWLHGIALNICRNHLRNQSRHARPIPGDQLDATAAARRGALSGILRQELGESTARAMAALPLPLREAFVYHFVEGMDYADISAITGVAAGTLRVRAHRARMLLRESLGPVVDTWFRQAEGG